MTNRLQCSVLGFIVDYKLQHDGNSPSIREIGDGCGLKSTNTVWWHLKKLENAGLISMPGSHKSRMICIVGGYLNAR